MPNDPAHAVEYCRAFASGAPPSLPQVNKSRYSTHLIN
jgi:hypothetical protein